MCPGTIPQHRVRSGVAQRLGCLLNHGNHRHQGEDDGRRLQTSLISTLEVFRNSISYSNDNLQANPRTDRDFNGRASELYRFCVLMPLSGMLLLLQDVSPGAKLETSKHGYFFGCLRHCRILCADSLSSDFRGLARPGQSKISCRVCIRGTHACALLFVHLVLISMFQTTHRDVGAVQSIRRNRMSCLVSFKRVRLVLWCAWACADKIHYITDC